MVTLDKQAVIDKTPITYRGYCHRCERSDSSTQC